MLLSTRQAAVKLFNPDFLEYLRTLELTVEIDAVREGTVVFPNDPIVRVTRPYRSVPASGNAAAERR